MDWLKSSAVKSSLLGRQRSEVLWRLLWALLLLLLIVCQWRLWFGEGSRSQAALLAQQIAAMESENAVKAERNAALAAEVRALHAGGEALEERARSRLGMIRPGETFYLFAPSVRD